MQDNGNQDLIYGNEVENSFIETDQLEVPDLEFQGEKNPSYLPHGF